MARGERRHVVQLDNAGDPVPDGEGGFTEGWQPLDPATWYCAIQPAAQADLERVTSSTVAATATHIVSGDYHPGITKDTRLTREDGRRYFVQSLRNLDERNITLELVCTEDLAGVTESLRNQRAPRAPAGAARPAGGVNE